MCTNPLEYYISSPAVTSSTLFSFDGTATPLPAIAEDNEGRLTPRDLQCSRGASSETWKLR